MILHNLFQINREFKSKKKIIIFGTGRIGLLTMTLMLQEGIYITAFCDRNPELWGQKIMNKDIISTEELVKIKDECAVIIAEEDFKSCREYLQDIGIGDIWIDHRIFSIINDCVWSFI